MNKWPFRFPVHFSYDLARFPLTPFIRTRDWVSFYVPIHGTEDNDFEVTLLFFSISGMDRSKYTAEKLERVAFLKVYILFFHPEHFLDVAGWQRCWRERGRVRRAEKP